MLTLLQSKVFILNDQNIYVSNNIHFNVEQ